MQGTDSHATTASGPHGAGNTPERAPLPRKPHATTGLVQVFPRALDAAPLAFKIRGETIIGRADGATITLADRRVSRRHASVESVPGGLLITDLDSRHGTYVAGSPLKSEPVRLGFGEVVRVGDTLLLAVSDLEPHLSRPRHVSAHGLGLREDVVAGPAFCQVLDHAARVAQLGQPVLLLGESGTGKEIVARSLHAARPARGPFVGLNISAIPETLFESELFGHERGAFTGATESRPGAFREASGGVLFLDEVADLRQDLQVKLLRVIDTHRVRPLGSRCDAAIDVQVIAATSRDLHEACAKGDFRHDLYYRLAGVVLRIPPLRERRDEVLLLALSILQRQAPSVRLTVDAAEALVNASWHGNVRNLRRVVVHAVSAAVANGRAEVMASDLPDLDPLGGTGSADKLSVEAVRLAMARAGGVASRAAGILGVSRSTFYNLCKRFGVEAESLRNR